MLSCQTYTNVTATFVCSGIYNTDNLSSLFSLNSVGYFVAFCSSKHFILNTQCTSAMDGIQISGRYKLRQTQPPAGDEAVNRCRWSYPEWWSESSAQG
jgi:hypothetical protein